MAAYYLQLQVVPSHTHTLRTMYRSQLEDITHDTRH